MFDVLEHLTDPVKYLKNNKNFKKIRFSLLYLI